MTSWIGVRQESSFVFVPPHNPVLHCILEWTRGLQVRQLMDPFATKGPARGTLSYPLIHSIPPKLSCVLLREDGWIRSRTYKSLCSYGRSSDTEFTQRTLLHLSNAVLLCYSESCIHLE